MVCFNWLATQCIVIGQICYAFFLCIYIWAVLCKFSYTVTLDKMQIYYFFSLVFEQSQIVNVICIVEISAQHVLCVSLFDSAPLYRGQLATV